MADLTNLQIKDSYKSVLHLSELNTGLSTSLQYVQDGDGTNSPIQVSLNSVTIDSLTTTNTLNTAAINVTGNIVVSGTVDGRDVATDGTKLDGIEANADVTDATNVNAAGATMNTDTDVSSNSWVLDEDNMASDSNTKVPTQQSVKAYVDAQDTNIASDTLTFTNKTFDANATGNSLSNVDVSDLANGTDGQLITWNASGAPTTFGPGTTGQVIQSNGAGAAPTFVDSNTVGSKVFLGEFTASNEATLDCDNIFDSTYSTYEVVIVEATPATDGANLRARVGTGSSPTYQSGASDYKNGSSTSAVISLASFVGNVSGETAAGTITVYGAPNTSFYTYCSYHIIYSENNGDIESVVDGTAYMATTAVTSIQFFASSGNITGTVRIYGVK